MFHTDNDKKKKFLIYVAYVTVIAALSYFILKFCFAYLLPFILGTGIAFLVQNPASKLSSKIKIKQGTASLFLVIFIYVVLFGILFLILYRFYFFLLDTVEKIPHLIGEISGDFTELVGKIESLSGKYLDNYSGFLMGTLNNVFESSSTKISEMISSFLKDFATAMPGFFFSTFVAIITGCYIAKDIDSLKGNLRFALKPHYINNLKKIWIITTDNVLKLIRGYFVLSAITFLLLSVGFYFIGVQNAIQTAIMVSIVDLLPVFGCGAVLLPWAIISIFNGNKILAIGLIILYLLVAAFRNISEPKIIGKQVGIHPLLTLVSMFLGLKIFGFLGVFILPLIVTVAYHFISAKVTEEIPPHSM